MSLSKLYSVASAALRETTTASNVIKAQSQQRPPSGIFQQQRRPMPLLRPSSRHIFGLIPKNQYENNQITKKFQIGHVLLHHWEIIPLFLCVVFDVFVVLGGALYTAFLHKVDTQFTKHNWNCISRNMDLRHPTIHKHLVFYQRYEPWPEMQDVLDKMTKAEHRNQVALDQCGHA